MLKVLFFLVALEFLQQCYGNMTQYDQQNSNLTQNVNSSEIRTENVQGQTTVTKQESGLENSQENETITRTKLEAGLENAEDSKKYHDDKQWTKSGQHFTPQMVGYQENDLHKDDVQNTKNLLRDQIDDIKQNENTTGMELVPFFRRIRHWKPRRIFFNSKNNPSEEDIKTFKVGYHQPVKSTKNIVKQNAESPIFASCCTVASNTITILKLDTKANNFNASEYLPAMNKATVNAPTYLPPSTDKMKVSNDMVSERGGMPDIDDFNTDLPVADFAPPEYDEPILIEQDVFSKFTLTTTSPLNTTNPNQADILSSDSYYRRVKYFYPKNTTALPILPKPAVTVDNVASTTWPGLIITPHQKTTPRRPSFTGPEYLPPKSTMATFSTTSSRAAMAFLIPLESYAPSPSPPSTEDLIPAKTTEDLLPAKTTNISSTTVSTFIVLEPNPFQVPAYLPSRINKIEPAPPLKATPVPETDNCDLAQDIDPKSSAVDPNLTQDENKTASNEIPHIDSTTVTSTVTPFTKRPNISVSNDKPKTEPKISSTEDPSQTTEWSDNAEWHDNSKLEPNFDAVEPIQHRDRPGHSKLEPKLDNGAQNRDRNNHNSKIEPNFDTVEPIKNRARLSDHINLEPNFDADDRDRTSDHSKPEPNFDPDDPIQNRDRSEHSKIEPGSSITVESFPERPSIPASYENMNVLELHSVERITEKKNKTTKKYKIGPRSVDSDPCRHPSHFFFC